MKDIVLNLKNMIVDLFVKMCGTRYYLVTLQFKSGSCAISVQCKHFKQLDIYNAMQFVEEKINNNQLPNIFNIIEMSHTQYNIYCKKHP